MIRLQSILIAGLIAVPTLLQAADFKFYSSHRQGYWWEVTMPKDLDTTIVTNTFYQGNRETFIGASRFGCKVTDDKYQGQVEFTIPHAKSSTPYVRVRQAWGKWMFTDMIGLTIGITDGPFGVKYALQGYNEEVDQGKFTGRRYHNDKVMLYQLNIGKGTTVALVSNDVNLKPVAVAAGSTKRLVKAESKIPQIQFKTGYKNDMLELRAMGAWNMFEQKFIDSTATTGKRELKENIHGLAVAGDFELNASIMKFMLAFAWGINSDHTGVNAWPDASVATLVNGEVKNGTMWGLPASVTLELNKKVSIILGGGACYEKPGTDHASAIQCMSVYGSCIYKPVAALKLIPEIGYIDQDEKHTKTAPVLYFGFKTVVDL
jgi:hypothetical protein